MTDGQWFQKKKASTKLARVEFKNHRNKEAQVASKHAMKTGSQDLLENVGILNEQQLLRNIQRTAINMQLQCGLIYMLATDVPHLCNNKWSNVPKA